MVFAEKNCDFPFCENCPHIRYKEDPEEGTHAICGNKEAPFYEYSVLSSFDESFLID